MIVYKMKTINGHIMWNRPIKYRRSDKDARRYARIDRKIKRNSRYWLN